MKINLFYLFIFLFSGLLSAQQSKNTIVPNENLMVENIPEISKDLATKVKKYSESRGKPICLINLTTEKLP